MSLKEDIRPITYVKNRMADLLHQVNETRRPVVITQNGEPRGVLQDPESYEQMRRAIGLLKLISQGEEDIRAGRTISHRTVFRQLRRELKARNRRHGEAPSL